MNENASVLDERKEAIESHDSGLGGTETSAVVGMNPYKQAIDVYLKKVGLAEPKDATEPMFWGTAQESIIRDVYSHRTGWKVLPVRAEEFPDNEIERWGKDRSQVLIRHKDRPFVIGSPDGIVPDAARGLEIKTSAFKGAEWGKPGSDEVPVHYSLQCAQYMAITGLEVWDLAVLFSGNRLEIFTLKRNPEIEEQILAAAKWFWETHVVAKVPPPVDGSESYTRYMAKKYALGSQTYIDADETAIRVAAALRETQEHLKTLESDARENKNFLADFIGENKGCYFPDGSRAQWIRPKPQEVVRWEEYALYLEKCMDDPSSQIMGRDDFIKEVPSTPYIRLYEATKNQKRLTK